MGQGNAERRYTLSLAINVLAKPTTKDSPCTVVSTLVPMYREWVILLLPAVETFSAEKAFDVVSGIPRWVEEEASFGEGVRCCSEVSRMGPFEGDGTLCSCMFYAPGLCKRLETSVEWLHLHLRMMSRSFAFKL